jgi:hypothetical protein
LSTDPTATKQKENPLATAKRSNVYTSIKKLPLRLYIEALDGDLSVLGDASPEVLEEAFIDLQGQFAEAIGGEEAVANVQRVGTVEYLRLKIERLQILIDAMYVEPCKVLAEQIREEGYSISLDKWEEDLQRVVKKAKNLLVELSQKEQPLKEQEQKNENIDISPADSLRIAAGVILKDSAYSPADIVTYDFCLMYRSFEKTHKRHVRADQRDN